MLLEEKRKFISFGGACPFGCNHCYTFSDDYQYEDLSCIQNMVESLHGEDFDIVYVSGHRENFVNPEDGLKLCEAIFDKYSVDILFTTRNIFNDEQYLRLEQLFKKMKTKGHDLFVCSSIPAINSYKKLEPNNVIPNPNERMNFLKRVFEIGIYTILTIRPLCPTEFIPIDEPLEIIDKCHSFSSAILSSGIVVDETILKRLKTFPEYNSITKESLMTCLENDNLIVDYVDVERELTLISEQCKKYGKALFKHSIPAIEYLKNQKSSD